MNEYKPSWSIAQTRSASPRPAAQTAERRAVWITWERHRRSIELADAFGAALAVLECRAPQAIRYPYLILRTAWLLIRFKPARVFAQHPSIVLAATVCGLRRVLRYQVVIDRHSNFKLHTLEVRQLKWRLFHKLSRYTVKVADWTIVTNEYLRALVETWGGRGIVLQDPIPDWGQVEELKLDGEHNIVVVSTFAEDEPIAQIIGAAADLHFPYQVYITGDKRRTNRVSGMPEDLPDNVKLTGFLPDGEYRALLAGADVVVVLTTADHTLTCGAYEAVGLGKAAVLSDTCVLREYFSSGAVYAAPSRGAIAAAIEDAVSRKETLELEAIRLRHQLRREWTESFRVACQQISHGRAVRRSKGLW
jgi:glycosyltransferase involved in cell wall biosynthesis